MDSHQIKLIVEGALLAAGKALSLQEIGNLFDPAGRPSNAQFREALAQIGDECQGRAFELREVGSGFRLQVRQEFGPWISRLWEEKPARYSRALLETLALVAYRQPITRAEIEEVRGVAVSTNIIKTLLERSWVKVVGHRDTPGRPAMYATTREFLDYFNLKSLGELPSLAEIKEITSVKQELELEAAMTVGIASAGDDDASHSGSEVIATNAPASRAEGDAANELLDDGSGRTEAADPGSDTTDHDSRTDAQHEDSVAGELRAYSQSNN